MGTSFPIIDLHGHVLPGLDDGPRTLGEALRLCQRYAAEGVSTVVATPHLCHESFDVTGKAIRQGAAALGDACRRQGLELEIVPGSEVRLQPEFLDALDAGELVTVGDGGRYVMVELSPFALPALEELFFELSLRQVCPILCHPERHPCFGRDPGLLADAVEQGCLVQVTAGSLLGAYGRGVCRTAEALLREDLVHVVASDAHSALRRPPLLRQAAEAVESRYGAETARRLFELHPGRIVRGEPVAAENDSRPLLTRG